MAPDPTLRKFQNVGSGDRIRKIIPDEAEKFHETAYSISRCFLLPGSIKEGVFQGWSTNICQELIEGFHKLSVLNYELLSCQKRSYWLRFFKT